MAKFKRMVGFSAFQFNPEELTSTDPYDLQDLVTEAFDGDISLSEVYIESGKLYIVVYGCNEDGTKERFILNPGAWLVEDYGYTQMTNEEFERFLVVYGCNVGCKGICNPA